ncbi:phenoloxidase-activating factor 3 [Hyalella azteca]|uniref:Phenoloxidase-activating factor 3 n=1 Tax=Hyalella azteca TaxID=294128 RepID=A0A8B7MZ56_HYAAZ|nr:phenoloxidase-activating factor 3 [Hyalella azteca]XP_018006863.1 phenoloxidase-activating factor 3 [Hyalella azteca]
MTAWRVFCVILGLVVGSGNAGATVVRTDGNLGLECVLGDGAVGRCEELTACMRTGGVARHNGAVTLCKTSSAAAVHVCCRRPEIIAMQMCSAWTQYWSAAASQEFNVSCITSRPLIYGGQETLLGEFPHIVAVGWWMEEKPVWKCGGSLITPFFVLTAAHCIDRNITMVVRLGEHDRSAHDRGVLPRLNLGLPPGLAGEEIIKERFTESVPIEQEINVTQIFSYPDYQKWYHDIGLLKLEHPAGLTARVLPACLPISPQHFEHTSTFAVAGWGRSEVDLLGSVDRLQKVKIDYIAPNRCWQRFNDHPALRPPWGVTKDMICAGADGKDSCTGDSGGPLMQEDFDLPGAPPGTCVPRVVTGVVSFGPAVCGQFGVYTRVAAYLDWITSIVAPNASYSQQNSV